MSVFQTSWNELRLSVRGQSSHSVTTCGPELGEVMVVLEICDDNALGSHLTREKG